MVSKNGAEVPLATEPQVQIAQAADEPIGRVESTDGEVWASRADGARLTLTKGDPV